MTRLIFVRHGQSNSNVEKSIDGRTLNSDLSDLGVNQAQNIGKKIKSTGIEIAQAYSSPSLRTTKTAQNILSELNLTSKLTLNEDERLHEKWYGSYEGASESKYAVVRKKEDEDHQNLTTFNEKFAYTPLAEIESMQDVYVLSLIHI